MIIFKILVLAAIFFLIFRNKKIIHRFKQAFKNSLRETKENPDESVEVLEPDEILPPENKRR